LSTAARISRKLGTRPPQRLEVDWLDEVRREASRPHAPTIFVTALTR
jgi:hypothetical protein